MKLKQKILSDLKASRKIKNRIAYELNMSVRTVERWFEDNNSKLTMLQVLNIIEDELGVEKEKLVEQEKIHA